MRTKQVQCIGPHGLHRMAYTEWGDPANPRVLVCVHGLTRNGRDFDELAQVLCGHYRVVCPDVAGRGRSDWLGGAEDYDTRQYLADMVTLIARLDVESVHWLGTSMGGLIGMILAGLPRTPVARLVMNDVGPVLTAAGLARIGDYLGKAPRFPSLEEGERFIRATSPGFGSLSDAQWRHLAVHSLREAGGGYEMRYDPKIAVNFARTAASGGDVLLWEHYDRVACPTLVVRGAESDLLTPETAAEMTRRGPCARLVEFAGVGHAPMFMDARQIDAVRDFFLAGR